MSWVIRTRMAAVAVGVVEGGSEGGRWFISWLTPQHSQVTRLGADNSPPMYGICQSVISLSLSLCKLYFFTKNATERLIGCLGGDKSLEVSPGQTFINRSKGGLCILNPMNGSIQPDLPNSWSAGPGSQHEYSICVSWSENTNPPRNLSYLWFFNKISNQLSWLNSKKLFF